MKYILFVLLFLTYTLSQIPEYNRKDFKHWVDFDRDCQDTRQEVLIEESRITPDLDEKGCKVIKGIWYDIYSDSFYLDPSNLDVDHFIPLKQAWISGAYKWSKEERTIYANYMDDKDHLIAVSFRANRSKGSKAPHEWMPPNKKYWKQYIRTWCSIKVKWGLTVTEEELKFMQKILGGEKIVYPKVR